MGEEAWTSDRPGYSDSALVCDRVHIRHWWTRGDVPGEVDRKGSWEVSGGHLCLGIPSVMFINMPVSESGSQQATEFHSVQLEKF